MCVVSPWRGHHTEISLDFKIQQQPVHIITILNKNLKNLFKKILPTTTTTSITTTTTHLAPGDYK